MILLYVIFIFILIYLILMPHAITKDHTCTFILCYIYFHLTAIVSFVKEKKISAVLILYFVH